MTQQNQKRLFAALVFLIALITYLFSLEPTASFWDCSEFIACAYKLEVGHAPGAPIYMLLGRFFAFFAGGNTEYVAFAINSLSAVASALTILLLFHIIYWLAEKLFAKSINKPNQHFILLFSSFIGALSYAFTDSFWFSAVEAEVYATSSLFSALVFWCITKYDREEKGWNENRWLVLIFFLLGLSVGIHLLNLLALPAMALVVYFKHYKFSKKGILLTLAASVVLVAMFVLIVIPGIVKMAAYSDMFFVNSLNMPVYFGALLFIALMVCSILFAMHYLQKQKQYVARFVVLLFSFWLIGYSSFTILVIRSASNPFVDINNVENVFGLVDYLNREQYPQRPLVYGNSYNSPITGSKQRNTYKLYNGNYHKDELNPTYEFHEKTLGIFPRMASTDARHAEAYQNWINIKGRDVKLRDADGKFKTLNVPTFIDNFKFFVKYQVGHMYLRYFMWNFAGKQNDTQGFGNKYHGNWMSGIKFIDNYRLGKQSDHVNSLNQSKTQNTYFFIPLLFGLLGFIYQLKHHKKSFWITFSLFLLTGPAIILYLNEVPITPRERDYVHVGSFMVFAIWIGLGVAAFLQFINSHKNQKSVIAAAAFMVLIALPGLLLSENWDDHDRSNRYTARDYGKNMLSSCEKNALLFTTADNDTYPIWYLQQVEGFRTDVRQILSTFLPVDWYADQLNYEHENCGKVPISFEGTELLMKTNQYFPVVNRIDSSIDVKEMVQFIKNNDKRTKVQAGNGELLNFIPGKKVYLNVNYENFSKQSDYLIIDDSLPTKIEFSLSKSYLTRDQLLILDILANNNWERPVYTIYPTLFQDLGLADYLHREGMLFRFLPYKNTDVRHNELKMLNHQFKLIHYDFVWGNVNYPDVFLDHTNKQMVGSFRFVQMFADVSNKLIEQNERSKAEDLIDQALDLFPPEKIDYSFSTLDLLDNYYSMGATKKADSLLTNMHRNLKSKLDYFVGSDSHQNAKLNRDIQLQMYLLQSLTQISQTYNTAEHKVLVDDLNRYYAAIM